MPNDIAHIDILKIDVQGHEYSVLKGGESLIALGAIGLVYFEYIHCPTYEDQADISTYLNFLGARNYRLISVFNVVQGTNSLNQCDLLFMNAALSH